MNEKRTSIFENGLIWFGSGLLTKFKLRLWLAFIKCSEPIPDAVYVSDSRR